MHLLLLSLGIGALPGFLADRVGEPADRIRLGYLDDAALPYRGADFTAFERDRLTGLGYELTTITARTVDSPERFGAELDTFDALYVCGGETFVLLESLRRHGLGDVLADRVWAGLPYVGLSAGSVIAGSTAEPVSLMDDPATAPSLTDHRGLGFVGTAIVPHSDGQLPPYPPALIEQIRTRYAHRYPVTFLRDDQAILAGDDGWSLIASP